MMNDFIQLVIDFVISLINLVILPIDNLIFEFLPELTTALNYISAFFSYITTLIPWVVSYFGLYPEILTLIVSYYIFKITVSFSVSAIKVAVSWYNRLKV